MIYLLGYLTQTNQASRVMTLYGQVIDNNRYSYYASHEYHPGIKIPLNIPNRLLHDREIIKVSGYQYPFRVNLYESVKCCQ